MDLPLGMKNATRWVSEPWHYPQLELSDKEPVRQAITRGVSKWILREVAKPLLPPEILARGKQGFGVPLEQWFGTGFGKLAREVLLDRRCRERGWLDPEGVQRVLAGRGLDRDAHARQVFTLTCLELWAQAWVDRPREALVEPPGGPLPLHRAVAATAKD